MRHFVVVGILVILTTILAYVGMESAGLMPVQASLQAESIDWLWNLEVVVIAFLFSLIVVPLTYSLVVFRRRKGDTTDAAHVEGNTTLEITWTVIPLITVVVFAYLGSYSLADTQRVAPDAMVVKVTGLQWSWKFQYPDLGITTTELYLPVNKAVVLQMESTDVLHSFWVPEFRIKQDVVPGRITEYRVIPILEGNFKVRCAEICGTSHAYMESPVVVVQETDFESWVAARQAEAATAAQTPEGRGELLVGQNGCTACHTLDGSVLIGPTWHGLFGRTETLSDGTSVVVDEAYITESIRDPQVKLVQGFPPTMPAYPFTDEQIADIIAYIKTLR
jgi:cytochrome c oxidase subunit 2